MAERQTLLSRNLGPAPTVQPAQQGGPAGSFGDSSGLINLGQSVQQAAGVVGSYATNKAAAELRARELAAHKYEQARKEHEKRQGQDYKLRYQADLETTVRGVKEQYNQKLANGEFANGGAHAWVQEQTRAAQAALKARYKDLSADPIFRESVPEAFQMQAWESNISGILEGAATEEGLANYQGRAQAASTLTATAFQTTNPGDHSAVHQELADKSRMIDGSALTFDEKLKLKKQLQDSAYSRLAMGAANGVRVSDEIMLSPLFSVEQQRSIQALNKAIKPGEAFPNQESARQELANATADPNFTQNRATMARVQRAADYLASKAATPELAREVYASVDLKAIEHSLETNIYSNLDNPKGLPLYEHLVTLNSRINNPQEAEAVFNSLGVKGADPKEKSAFITRIQARVAEDLAKFTAGRGNEVLERHPSLAPIASHVNAEFTAGRLSPAAANAYVTLSKQLAAETGLPEHLQQHYPSAVKNILLERARSGDSDTVQNLTQTFIQGFGVAALHGLADSFFRADQKSTGATSANVTEGTYGMLFKLMAWDQTRVIEGEKLGVPQQPNATALFKPFLDGLKKYEELDGTLFKGSRETAMQAYEKVRFKDASTISDAVSRGIFFDKDGDFNRPVNIEKALTYQAGGNPVAAAAFRELFIRNLVTRVYGPGAPTTGETDDYRAGAAIKAAKDLNNLFANIFTVYDASGGLSKEPVYDIMPSVFRSEGSFQAPVLAGAANQEDQSEQLTASLKVISYYGPRKEWDRGILPNYLTRLANLRRDTFFYMDSGPNEVPEHLQVPWERAVISKSQEDFTSSSGTGSEVADFLWRRASKPASKSTAASVLFAQSGAFRYDPKTMGFKLMLNPGVISTGATDDTQAPGAPQPLLFNYSDNPEKPLYREFSIPATLVREFDQSRRHFRARGLTPVQERAMDARRSALPANESLPTGP